MGQTGRKAGIRSLIGFEVFVKTACLSFCFPLFRLTLKLCIRAAGYSYVTKENLHALVLSPLSLVCIVLGLAAAALFVLFEMNTVNLALQHNRSGSRLTVPDLFFGGLEKTGRLFERKRRGILLAFLALLFVVLINLPVVFFLLIGIGQTRGVAYAVLQPPGLLILAAVAVLLWWAALPGCFIVFWSGTGNGAVRRLFRLGGRGIRQYYGRIFRGLFVRSIVLFVLESIVYFSGLALMIVFVLWLTPETISAVLLIRLFQRYHFIICILFASVNAVIYEYFCASLFFEEGLEGAVRYHEEKRPVYVGRYAAKRNRRRRKLFLAAVALVSVLAVVQMAAFFQNGNLFLARTLDVLCITAHRGASDGAPENTAAAVELAVKEAADYVEIDVRLTADGVPVLLHDAALFRTTRVPKYIGEVTYEEVCGYDAGSSYSAEFAGERIPGLEEILERYGGETGFNIELKTAEDRALAESVVELIERYHLEESCVITSSFYQQLVWVKELNKDLKTGYILPFVYGEFYKSEAADFFSIHSGFVSEELVEQVHSVGKEVHVWTVNRENELKRMKAIGVDNIITDKPAYAREVIYEGALAETIEEWILFLTPKK